MAAGGEEPDPDPWTWFFGRPGEFRRDMALLNTSPERLLLAALIAPTFGLVANLWGETEFLISAFPQVVPVVMDLKLDSLYAVEGLKGYYDEEYEVHYPSTWLFDQRVQLSKLGQDPMFTYSSSPRARKPNPVAGLLPDAAWGPAGGGSRPVKERENLSVVKQQLPPKADGSPASIKEILGEPEPSLRQLLESKIAPANSGRSAEPLRAAYLSRSGGVSKSSNEYYQYEWRTTFEATSFQLRSFSSVALGPPDDQGRRNLYTLTLVLPESVAASEEGTALQAPKILERFYVKSA